MKCLINMVAVLLVLVLALSEDVAQGQEVQSLSSGVFTEAQAARGSIVYIASCESCHAADLRGNSNAPSLLGMSFMFLWEGRSLEELFVTIQSTMPSENPGSLSMQSYVDVMSYILQANGFSDGASELQAELDSLRLIQISD